MTDALLSSTGDFLGMCTKCTMHHRRAVRAPRTDPGAKEERQKRKGAWISHTSPRTRGTRYANVYKATGAFCSPRCSCAYSALSPCRSFPRVLRYPAGFLSQTHMYPVLRRRIRWPRCNPIDRRSSLVPQRRATTGRSFGRSQGIISLEAPGGEESRVYGV